GRPRPRNLPTHILRMEGKHPAPPQPCRIDEGDGVENERVAFPVSHRIPHVRDIELRLFVALAAIGRDDAIFAVTAAGVAAKIEEGDVVLRLVDASRRGPPPDP